MEGACDGHVSAGEGAVLWGKISWKLERIARRCLGGAETREVESACFIPYVSTYLMTSISRDGRRVKLIILRVRVPTGPIIATQPESTNRES